MHLSRVLSYVGGSVGLLGFSAQSALALPTGTPSEAAQAREQRAAMPFVFEGDDFLGTVALDNCSGSLVRFPSSKDSDKALVLTNGHCYEGGFLQPGAVLTNADSSRTFDLLSADASSTLGTIYAASVQYATMTDTDVTLYGLTQTYADIKASYGVDALTVTAEHPQAGTAITVASGFWRTMYTCSIDSFVYELREGAWTFKDSIRYTDSCHTIGGTSGSPILKTGTKEVIGINNTINQSGQRCTVNNPCEVDSRGKISIKSGIGYGQEVIHLAECLSDNNTIDLQRPGCSLPKPR